MIYLARPCGWLSLNYLQFNVTPALAPGASVASRRFEPFGFAQDKLREGGVAISSFNTRLLRRVAKASLLAMTYHAPNPRSRECLPASCGSSHRLGVPLPHTTVVRVHQKNRRPHHRSNRSFPHCTS